MLSDEELGLIAKLDILEEKNLDRPLVLRFAATGSQYAITQGGALMMRSNPLPISTAARLATWPSRKTGMVVPYAPRLEAQIIVRTIRLVFFDRQAY